MIFISIAQSIQLWSRPDLVESIQKYKTKSDFLQRSWTFRRLMWIVFVRNRAEPVNDTILLDWAQPTAQETKWSRENSPFRCIRRYQHWPQTDFLHLSTLVRRSSTASPHFSKPIRIETCSPSFSCIMIFQIRTNITILHISCTSHQSGWLTRGESITGWYS